MLNDIPKHKVFISYHHANDKKYKEELVKMLSEVFKVFISKSVNNGDIDDSNLTAKQIYQKIRDNYLKKSTVTIVLIGTETWKRKHIDWEIAGSIDKYNSNTRSGLVGIILPTRLDYYQKKFDCCTIPPRLYDNYKCGYAKIYDWEYDIDFFKRIIHEAYENRFKIKPNNSRYRFTYNRFSNSWC